MKIQEITLSVFETKSNTGLFEMHEGAEGAQSAGSRTARAARSNG